MFTRKNKDDLAHFKALSVGKWVRAQGRIEEDTFVRDLVMMMSDIEEIKKQQNKINLKKKSRIPFAHFDEPNGWYPKYFYICRPSC